MFVGGDEDEAIGRVGEGLAHEACRVFLLVSIKKKILIFYYLKVRNSKSNRRSVLFGPEMRHHENVVG